MSDEGLEKLRGLAAKYPSVAFLAITGSLARKGLSTHDLDVAVKLSERRGKYETLASLLADIAGILGIPEDLVDVIDLDRADPEVKASIVRNSIVIIDRGYYGELLREVDEAFREYGEYRELSIREWLLSEDPTSVDPAVVKRRLDFVKSEARFLREEVLKKPLDEVKGSPILSRVLERGYQLIVEALVDVARHVASSMGWGPCFTAKDYVEKLAEHGVIPEELASELIKRIRLRNIIIHRYLDVDYDELYSDAPRLIAAAEEFERHIARFLRRREGR
ncbi:type VII toxin-antitoxin system HepT family RNase toxin [Infirmifilum sp. NZ]|uniref:type VII toxin-antitoxin system HepT family RNase toxin n=1 Tax=Infirmifilum sp. NZ TaxID=2926850 RepID=UPI0027A59AC0|nr:HepT-like ribonuclease domain-containing protein [Infirmifilum sp. NZ]UNQ74396.1 DUF86 domain-containing protein [Infirmifilum sp. NZ]